MGAAGRPRKQRQVHIALLDLNFSFTAAQVGLFGKLWREGQSVSRIAKRLRRDPDEVALLVMDQARAGAIEKRPSGARGENE